MPQIDTSTNSPPKWLTETAEPHDKETWRKAYAMYLHSKDKNPFTAVKERIRLDAVLPVL